MLGTAARSGGPASFAEDGADGGESPLEDEGETGDDDEGDERHGGADAEQDGEGEDGGHEAAEELDQSGADQVADAFDVVHDARNNLAGFVCVVEGDGEAADVLLDFLAEFGDEALAGFGEKLGEREAGDALDGGGGDDGGDEGEQEIGAVLADDGVDQVLARHRENEAADAVDDHEQEAKAEQGAAGAYKLEDEGPDGAETRGGEGFFRRGRERHDKFRLAVCLGFEGWVSAS